MDLDSDVQILFGKLLESTLISIKLHVHITLEPAAIFILVHRPFLPMVMRRFILAHWAVHHVESNLEVS
jgi:hypothetical protein